MYSLDFIDYCERLPLKLTSLRKAVLWSLWLAQKPLKAYELLSALAKIKSNAQPPSLYRALDFFVEAGVVHKIESIQSYTLCHAPNKHQLLEMLMVCHQCYQVIEIYDHIVKKFLIDLTCQHSFRLKQDAVELKGLCAKCV